jgi:hypothetical protein
MISQGLLAFDYSTFVGDIQNIRTDSDMNAAQNDLLPGRAQIVSVTAHFFFSDEFCSSFISLTANLRPV